MLYLEYWRPLKYYFNRSGIIEVFSEIEVSNVGRFRYISRTTKRNRNINISLTATDYPTIIIKNNKTNKFIRLLVHVAMITSFSETLPDTKNIVVDHIDRNKYNYSLSNLRFTTYSINNKNRYHPSNNISLIIIDDKLNIIKIIESYTKIEKRKYIKILIIYFL